MEWIILILIGSIVILGLQIFLSLRKNKWLGLIMPSITLIISYLLGWGISSFYILFIPTLILLGSYILFCLKKDKAIQTQWLVLIPLIPPILISLLNQVTTGFVILFIPTLIFIVIYLFCRFHLMNRKEIEKMTIKDL